MYDEMRRIQTEEKKSNTLSSLKEDTYSRAFAYMESLKKSLSEKWDVQKVRELENFEKVFYDVEKRRVEKILLAVFNQVYNKLEAPRVLTSQEKIFYEKVGKVMSEYREMMSKGEDHTVMTQDEVPKEQTNSPENGPQVRSEDIINVRLLKDVPRFRASDGKEYGPFCAGEVCTIPRREGEIMIKRNAAELLQ